MLKKIGLVLAGVAVMTAACGSDDKNQNKTNDINGAECRTGGAVGSKTEILDGDITQDSCLSADTIYVLNPKADGSYVKVTSGATLTVQPGTTVKGNVGSALVITRGAKIMAEGTADAPIVFTSNKPEGSRRGGDWGGLLIMGSAPTNWEGNNQLFEALPETEDDGRYGGDNAADNSGVVTYVRIEFAGFEYDTDKEFNALTLCGVGAGTTIDYIQVHRGSDDGVEIFGGTVNVKHVVSSQNEDDGFDTDNGWTGKAQFMVIQHINGTSTDPNGYESDDHKNDFEALPRTSPEIYNVTLIGDPDETSPSFGAVLRRGTAGMYYNQIVMGFPSAAIEVRDAQTTASYPNDLGFASSIFFSNADGANWSGAQADFDEDASFMNNAYSNREIDPALGDPSNLTAPDFRPGNSSPALSGAATPPNDGFFDVSATFVGAMNATDWTAGWTSYVQE